MVISKYFGALYELDDYVYFYSITDAQEYLLYARMNALSTQCWPEWIGVYYFPSLYRVKINMKD